MKQCFKCRKWKPVTEFYKREGRKDGRRSWCKKCTKEHYEENKEKIRKRQTNYLSRIKEEAVAIYGGKCQNKECPYPDINTDSIYLEFHHKEGQAGVKKNKKETSKHIHPKIIKYGIQEDIELYCAPCHKYADIRDGTYFPSKFKEEKEKELTAIYTTWIVPLLRSTHVHALSLEQIAYERMKAGGQQ